MFKKKSKKKLPTDKEFEYCIANASDDSIFKAQCKALEQGLIDLIDDGIYMDDDGSRTQFYLYRDLEITVLYDTDLQEVYVDSPIDVAEYIIGKKE